MKKGLPSNLASGFKEGHYGHLILSIAIVLLLFSISRLIFYLFNSDSFSGLSSIQLLMVFAAGIRFDLASILIINLPFIFINIIPHTIKNHHILQKFGNLWFFIANGTAFLANAADMVYFRFTNTRSTAEIFQFVRTGDDFIKMLPSYLSDYWEVPLFSSILIFILFRFFYFTRRKTAAHLPVSFSWKYFVRHSFWFLLFFSLTLTGSRGGWQMRPINIVTAGKYAGAQYSPLILNTAFSIIKTYGQDCLKPIEYFTEDQEIDKIFSPCKNKEIQEDSFSPRNVVLIILESFSAEYSAFLNPGGFMQKQDSFTPFLDSLMGESQVYVNSYASASRSIDAIPAIISSIPHLMSRSFILSAYVASPTHSLAHELNKKGYRSMFFHGGSNGTMGFDDYAKIAGFHEYYGRDEFNNDDFFDGSWGIFDEEFLKFMAYQLNKQSQPFFATAFTLSSHHPYTLPGRYREIFNKGLLPIHNSVLYTDNALRLFFKEASQMPWFKNTLFVITADHTSEASNVSGLTRKGIFQVPLLFYQKGVINPEKKTNVAQHTDIMPTVLDFLNYDKNYIAFGESLLQDSIEGMAIHYHDNIYQIIDDEYILLFDGQDNISLFNHKTDHLLRKNLLNELPGKASEMNIKLKAFIQQYNNRVISNELVLK